MSGAPIVREAAEAAEYRWIEAVEWHALRCGKTGLVPAQEAAWQVWWRDADNRRVYAACARLHADAQRLAPSDRIDRTRAVRQHEPTSRPGRRPMRFVPVGAVLLAAVVGGAMLIRHQARHVLPTRPAAVLAQRIIYHTAPGQTQRITLRDGSTVILGGATTLTVSLTAQRRTVDLDRGEAWFHVVHRNDWPFVVKAGGGTITDLGTAFVVDRESNRVEVTVTEGLVQVAVDHPVRAPRLSSERHRAIRLHRGERLTYGENAHSVVRAVNPRAALAWTTGELEFSQEPLSAVIENVDRYTRHPIAVSPAAGRLRLTTLVMSRRIHEWLEGLSRVLPVIVERRGARVCVRLRAAQTTYLNNKCGDP